LEILESESPVGQQIAEEPDSEESIRLRTQCTQLLNLEMDALV
jgi:hypothetical protein